MSSSHLRQSRMQTQNKRTLLDWFYATRPWSYPASTMPIALTLAYYFAEGMPIDPINAIWALLNIVILHAAGNVWSDSFDYLYGVDRNDTHGVRILANGKFTAREFVCFSLVLFVLGTICALFLVYRTGLPFLAITFIGIAAALLYPPLKYRAWGDVVIFIAYTLTPMFAASWIITSTWSAQALYAVLPTGILTVGILHANNLRDIATDTRAGIRTLASVLGQKNSIRLYKIELAASFIIMIGAVLGNHLPITALVAILAALPAFGLWKTVSKLHDEDTTIIAKLDAETAQAQMIFSLLMIAGLCLSGWLN